jgi:hypothetical protein
MAAVRFMKMSRTGGHCYDAKNGHMGGVKKFTIVESHKSKEFGHKQAWRWTKLI